MTRNPGTGPVDVSAVHLPASFTMVIRFLVIPVLVYVIWVLEIFLFGGVVHLFPSPTAPALVLYTLVACILMGLILPVFLIRRAFISGAITMFQFGFRSMIRTIFAVALTCVMLYGCVLLFSPPGLDQKVFVQSFLLMVPTGISTAMICWVVAGTHVQALVRYGGPVISIPVGIVVTGILFGIAMLVMVPVQHSPDLFTLYLGAGMLMAVFFFAVRDIYATGIAVTGCMVFLFSGSILPAEISMVLPWVYAAAIVTAGVLVGIHRYLSLRFVTIQIPRK
ncbi:hypothetical protein [Methanoregula sp.]|uniref:hypothetical protein n=1 Tax=Methanoregula sp. TaxID=2052170 RepID=UPI003C74B72E